MKLKMLLAAMAMAGATGFATAQDLPLTAQSLDPNSGPAIVDWNQDPVKGLALVQSLTAQMHVVAGKAKGEIAAAPASADAGWKDRVQAFANGEMNRAHPISKAALPSAAQDAIGSLETIGMPGFVWVYKFEDLEIKTVYLVPGEDFYQAVLEVIRADGEKLGRLTMRDPEKSTDYTWDK